MTQTTKDHTSFLRDFLIAFFCAGAVGAGTWIVARDEYRAASAAAGLVPVDQLAAMASDLLGARLDRALATTALLAQNSMLAEGLSEVDDESVAAVLAANCPAAARCVAYDVDGDVVGDGEGADGEGVLSSKVQLRVVRGAVEIAAVATVGSGDDTFGRVRVTSREEDLGHDLARLTGSQWRLEGSEGWSSPQRRDGGWITNVRIAPVRTGDVSRSWSWLLPGIASILIGLTFAFYRRSTWQRLAAVRAAAALQANQIAEREASHGARAQELERRVARMTDLLAIDPGLFRVFRDKVHRLSRLVEEEIVALATAVAARTHLTRIFRLVHTLKSNARLFGLVTVHHSLKGFEDDLAEWLRQERLDSSALETLAGHVAFVRREVETLAQIRQKLFGDEADRAERQQALELRLKWLASIFGRTLPRLAPLELSAAEIERIRSEFHVAASSVGREDVVDYLVRYDRMLREMAVRLGKEVEPIKFVGNNRFFDVHTMEMLSDVLLHALRNALDHGIETTNRRIALGKPRAGRITVEANMMGDFCVVSVTDDGRGVDLKELAEKLVERGFAEAEAAGRMSDEQLLDAVFHTGFSTANAITDISGRGVGMDVVREISHQLGGDVKLETTTGHGCRLQIHFPQDEARFASRLAAFDLLAMLRATLARVLSVNPTCVGQVKSTVGDVATVVADRLFCGHACYALMTRMIGVGAQHIAIELRHAGTLERCELGFFELNLVGRKGDGSVVTLPPAALQDEDLEAWLMGAGLYVSEQAGGLTIGMQGSTLDRRQPIVFALCVEDPELVQAALTDAAAALGTNVILEFWLGPSAAHGDLQHVTLVVDASASMRAEVVEFGKSLQRPNVVILCSDASELPLGGPDGWDGDPLVVAGPLDKVVWETVLEAALRRHLARVRQAPRREAA